MKTKIIKYGEHYEIQHLQKTRSKEFYRKLVKQRKENKDFKKTYQDDECLKDAIDLFGANNVSNDDYDERFKQSIYRTKKRFRELIKANIYDGEAWFVGLTIDKPKIYDRDEMLRFLYNFRRRLPFEAKALTIIEPHKKGDLHAHMIMFDVPPGYRYKELHERWGHGIVRVKRITEKSDKDIMKMANYMTKYLTKETVENVRRKSEKSYYVTRNLKKPSVITDGSQVKKIMSQLKRNGVRYNEFATFTDYWGFMTRDYYIMKETDKAN